MFFGYSVTIDSGGEILKKIVLITTLLNLLITTQAYNLRVIAKGLKNNKGKVQIAIYNKDGTIPDKEQNRYYKMKRVSIHNKKAQAVFTNLPSGRFAVSVYHDENNNHKIDKGLIMPIEGIGLSNYKSVNLFHLPNFKNANFLLNHNKIIQIELIYL